MAKVLKSRFVDAQTVNGNGEFIGGREAAAALQARLTPSLAVQDVATAGPQFDPFSITFDGITLTKGETGEIGLPCPSGKELLLHYMSFGGGRQTDSESPLLRMFDGSEIADEGAVSIAVGGSFSGNIDFTGDTDNITVFLVAGQTYLISLRGTGPQALNDTFLQMRNPSGTLLPGSQAQDDDGGIGLNSLMTIASGVTVTGNYQIRVAAFANPGDPGLGGYTVDVRQRPPTDQVGDTNATSVPLALGTTFGFRDASAISPAQPPIDPALAGDLDRYSVELVAGHFYTFDVAGSYDYTNAANPFSLPAGTIDTFLYLTNAAGGIVAFNDDNDFPNDASSSIGFFATTSGTFYLNVTGYSPNTGGYAIDFQDVDFANLDPLDSINWFSADEVPFVDVGGVPTAYVYFAVAGESFGELNDAGTGPRESFGWTDYEKQQVMLALEEYEHILGVNYEITTDSSAATFRLITTTSTQFGAYFYPQDPGFGTQQGIGAFNVDNLGWDPEDVGNVNSSGGLIQGGFAFSVILHEFGHAHGLAHPHDNGGGSDIMLGVGNPDALGIFDLNQSIYTVMSYNDGWETHPDGALAGNGLPLGARADAGWAATMSAFDVALLQQRYGVTPAYAAGDNTYSLLDVNNEGTFYTTIWDTGGTDTIAYISTSGGTARDVVIDLTAATIDYSPTGGGVMSFVRTLPGETTGQAIKGGFTIAQGVVIENATGDDGDDNLIGNSAANVLTGNGGADNLIGRGGDDTIHGDTGTDTAYYDGNRADYTITAIISGGQITGFTVKDNNIAAPANSGNPVTVANEGTDTLDGVEQLDFADVAFSLAGTVAVFDGDGSLVSMHSTIQEAIDATTTQNGYTIFASAGTYAENINVTKDLTIQGANLGVAGDDTRGAETVLSGSATIASTGVTIDGFRIVGDSAGPLGSTGVIVNSAADDFSLMHSVLSSDSAAGFAIFVGLVTGLDVGNNLIEDYSIGMYIAGGNTAGSVHDNVFQGDGGPISGLRNGVNSETSLVLIQNNTFDGIYAGSLNLFPFGPDPVDLLDYILGNFITNSGAARPVQVNPTALSTSILGTDFNEAFYDANQGGPGELMVSLSFDGRGGDDHIYGNSFADDLAGGDGADRIFANQGDDTLNGGAGNDLLDGEGGIDTAVFADAELAYTDTLIGWLTVSSEGNDFLQNVEIVDDSVGGRNLLVGSTGFAGAQDALDEAVDGDTVRLSTGTYTGTFNYTDSGLTVIAQPNAQIDATFAGTPGITIAGANLNDTINTGAGNDIVLFNVTTGGSDIVNLDGGTDVVLLSGNAGQIRLSFTSAEVGNNNANDSNTMPPNQDGGLAVRLQAEDGAGGLTGPISRYDDEGIVFVAGAGQTFDVRDLVSGVQRGDQFEVVVLGTLGADTLTAVQASRSYYFNAGMGNDTIFGGTANDFLVGGAGDDFISGGAGTDTGLGGGGNDTYVIDSGSDVVLEAASGGVNDAVYTSASYTLAAGQEIETLSTLDWGSTAALDLTGNAIANYMIGNAGNNQLNGGAGADAMHGLGGSDTYIIDNSADQVIEASGGGANDGVYTSASYTLAAGQEIETLSTLDWGSAAALDLTGNEFGNYMIGNAGANVLDGKGGNDALHGLGGADVFAFTTAAGAGDADQIADFLSGTDKIGLDDAVFAGIGAPGSFDANAFVVGSAAADADDRIVYDQATGQLFYDADGNGSGAAVLFATLNGTPILTASDFQVI